MTNYIERHGRVAENGRNALRGWINSSLTSIGREEAGRAAQWLGANAPDLKQIVTADLRRHLESAELVARELPQARIIIDPELRPWNIGIFAGKPPTPDFMRYVKHPDMRPPSGESLTAFTARTTRAFRSHEYQPGTVLILSTSSITAIQNVLTGKPAKQGVEVHDVIAPGEVAKITRDGLEPISSSRSYSRTVTGLVEGATK